MLNKPSSSKGVNILFSLISDSQAQKKRTCRSGPCFPGPATETKAPQRAAQCSSIGGQETATICTRGTNSSKQSGCPVVSSLRNGSKKDPFYLPHLRAYSRWMWLRSPDTLGQGKHIAHTQGIIFSCSC